MKKPHENGMNKRLESRSRLFKALSEPVRLKILAYLLDKGECTCCCELGRLLKKDQSVIFRHIIVLRDAGLLNTNKKAKSLMCCIKDKKMVRSLLEG
jgi:DNA-binding transcriptional ArsR family regulator